MPTRHDFFPDLRLANFGILAGFLDSDFFSKLGLKTTAMQFNLFSSPEVRWITGVVILSALMILAITYLCIYLRRFLICAKLCSELEVDLKKNRRDLASTQELLAENSSSHRSMLDEAGSAIFEFSESDGCVYANKALGKLLGVPEKNLLGEGLVGAVHPEDREEVRQQWRGFFTSTDPFEFSYRFLRADGEVVHVIERGSILRKSRWGGVGYFGQLMDVGEQLQDCLEARRLVEQTTDGFYRLSLNEPVPVGELPAEQVAEHIYQHATLTLCSSELAAFYGQPAGTLTDTLFRNLPGGCGFFEGPGEIKRFVDNGFCISGEEGGRTDHRGKPHCLKHEVIGTIEDGKLTAIWGTLHDITLEKRRQEESKDREALLHRILNSIPGDVSVKDTRCRYLFVNRGFEDRTSIPVDDWIDKTVFEVLPGAARDTNKTGIQAMKSGQLCRTLETPAGANRPMWVETLEQPLMSDDGVVEGVVGISIDVTDRVLKQQVLERAEARFRYLVEQNPSGIILADAASKQLTYANPAFCDLFGYTDDEIVALKVDDLHSPGSRKQVLAGWNERASHAQSFEEALPCQRKDRSMLFAEVAVAAGSVDGQDQVIGVYSDAADRKRIESDLECQRDLQTGLVNSASMLVATVDCNGILRSANDTLLECLGRNESDLVGKPYADVLVCEEDRGLLSHAFVDPVDGVQKDYELRLVAADGTLYTTACRVREGIDPSGETTGFTVCGVDVTQVKALEQQLRGECDGFRNQLAESESKRVEMTESYTQSEQQRESLAHERKQLEKSLAVRVRQFEETMAEREQHEAELARQIQEFESRRSGMSETLEMHRAKLEEESGRCKQLDELLKKTQQEFSEEKERIESEAREKIENLETGLETLRACESELASECCRVNNDLSDTKKELQSRIEELESGRSKWEVESERLAGVQQQLEQNLTQSKASEKELKAERSRLSADLSRAEKSGVSISAELKSGRSKWDTETERLLSLERDLEGKVAGLSKQLKQVTAQRDELERDLKISRKEADAGMKTVQVQVKQSAAPLKLELKELNARKKQLEIAQEKSNRKLTKLETAFDEHMQELKGVSAARKEEGQVFQRTQRDLKKQLQMRKSKIDKLVKQTETDAMDRLRAEERWKKDRNVLFTKAQELEELLRERTHELTFAGAASRGKEESFTVERKELRDLIAAEKEKHARILDQTSGDVAEHCRAKDAWEEERKTLQTRIQKMEETAADRAKNLAQITGERVGLEARLKDVQAEAARQTDAVEQQIQQKTKELTGELKIQHKLEEKLKAEQNKLSGRLSKMQTALDTRSEEVADLKKTKQELKERIAAEKENHARILDQTSGDVAEHCRAKETWEEERQTLQTRIQKLEETAVERAGHLEQVTGERVSLEAQLKDVQADAARQMETIDEQIEQKTRDLVGELKAKSAHEEKLKAGQKELGSQLDELQAALDKRTEEAEGLLKTKQELEDLVELGKESLTHRISLFKEEMSESRKAERTWKQREEELQGAIVHTEKELDQRNHAVANEIEERKKSEQEVEWLKKASVADHRMIYDLAEDLNDPLLPVLGLSREMLADRDLPVGVYAPLSEINRSAERLQSILSYRRELSCLGDGSVRAQPDWFNLDDFLEELSDEFSERAESKKLFFTFSREGDLSGDVYADQEKTHAVLSTLYDRALHGTQKGLVGLHAVCEACEDGGTKLAFLLLYKGIDEDPVLTKGLLDSVNERRPCAELSADDFQLDLVRRKALMMGGKICIENPSKRTPVLSFALPVEQKKAAHDEAEDIATMLAETVR